MLPPPPRSTLFPYTTLFRSRHRDRDSRQYLLGQRRPRHRALDRDDRLDDRGERVVPERIPHLARRAGRSEEHTSELQSRRDLVCRLLLEKKNKQKKIT